MKQRGPEFRATWPIGMSPTKEHRQSPLILATVPLEIHSNGVSLAVFTGVINLHGAPILSPINWPQGTLLHIDSKKTGLQVRGRVVWSGSREREVSGFSQARCGIRICRT
jgi:hypothetical protein